MSKLMALIRDSRSETERFQDFGEQDPFLRIPIGRDPACAVVLEADDVEARHAVFIAKEGYHRYLQLDAPVQVGYSDWLTPSPQPFRIDSYPFCIGSCFRIDSHPFRIGPYFLVFGKDPTRLSEQLAGHLRALDGGRAADGDLQRGELKIYTWGPPSPWDEEMHRILRDEYAIQVARGPTQEWTNGYNRVAEQSIQSRFGALFLRELEARAQSQLRCAQGHRNTDVWTSKGMCPECGLWVYVYENSPATPRHCGVDLVNIKRR